MFQKPLFFFGFSPCSGFFVFFWFLIVFGFSAFLVFQWFLLLRKLSLETYFVGLLPGCFCLTQTSFLPFLVVLIIPMYI